MDVELYKMLIQLSSKDIEEKISLWETEERVSDTLKLPGRSLKEKIKTGKIAYTNKLEIEVFYL